MNAREMALQVINEIIDSGAYSNIALAKKLHKSVVSEQDRRFITELVYGTVKTHKTLDYFLAKFITRKLSTLSPVILNILRLGLYQILFLTKVPPSAACNQSVELAKKYGHAGTVKFVNGVLRNMIRQQDKLTYPDPAQEPDAYLAYFYFHPLWLVQHWLKQYGFSETEALCAANNEIPPLTLRTNTLKITREELLKKLRDLGVVCEALTSVPEGILVTEHASLDHLQPLQEGFCQVQDTSSMLVAPIVDPQPGDFVIDACSAPGGKSTHMAALMQNNGRILAVDLHEHKLPLIEQNAKRLGISIIETLAYDATKLSKSGYEPADRVLVDAPCSGLGVLRRKSDSRWRKDPKLLQELPKLQLEILREAARCVKPGGVLVYSTCTIETAENEAVIERFLQEESHFVLEPAGKYLPQPTDDKVIRFFPHRDGQDGFFIARLRRSH